MPTPHDYLETADVWTILDLIVAEWSSDPQSVQCFDLRLVERAKQLIIGRRVDLAQNELVHLSLTPSHLMALRSLVAEYLYLTPRRTEVYIDAVRNVETSPEELLERLMRVP
jgi:hypothetical protein